MSRLAIVVVSAVVLCFAVTEGQAYVYSVDLGGDLDLSDPVSPANNTLDCGDINGFGLTGPLLVVDDTGATFPNTGYPFVSAPQPAPAAVGTSTVADYANYFDLDAMHILTGSPDQMLIIEPTQAMPSPSGPFSNLYLDPPRIDLSYDHDGPAGWAVSGDVPTTAATTVPNQYEVRQYLGAFGAWSHPLTLIYDEASSFALGPNPPGEANDDDIDALCLGAGAGVGLDRYLYWSPDQEANMGLDAGSIYVTDLLAAGQNRTLALDDVNNLGVPEDTDVDAWEFCLISKQIYDAAFTLPTPHTYTIVGVFSVDQDDTDTLGINESGGLNPNTIYLTNLIGEYRDMQTYEADVDAIVLCVPEPASLILLGLGAMAIVHRRRRA